ncbi:alpha/beta hydrolase [Pedobacter sp. HMWF019]|uniref:alpha/beta hydrolase n=1 Tax=Pedobacter sp. HMWF019 TaxID=2056856 RepID=UPI000D3BB109|nr:alpha/beta hydrolase [Pedobacter sp. HMWF019]PTS94114.1 alpha/beta hydrolase [Pedobacter sp. HMWF019]
MRRIYFISGLGADRRAFRRLVFPVDVELIHLDWITPLPKESLQNYAARLSEGIDPSVPFYLIGLSFGGMLATEIAKKLKPIHTFLISSVPVYTQLPWYYRTAGFLRLERMVPLGLMKQSNSIGLKFLGGKTSEELSLLKQLIEDSDPYFMKWALTCILNWRNKEIPTDLTHIHGTNDNILPAKYTKPDFLIKGGGHFMVYGDAGEISKIIIGNI